ncbi:MAG: hypothetical protein FWG50_01485 [Kiritimatiellaeota bacterium]|nr:hypothetical protein [Kiritimatiellota bacterium]
MKNRKKNAHLVDVPKLGLALVVIGASAALGYKLIDGQNKKLEGEIHKHDVTLRALDDEYERELARWDTKVKTVENLKRTIADHGLGMSRPVPERQIVNVDEAGRVIPGQSSAVYIRRLLDLADEQRAKVKR